MNEFCALFLNLARKLRERAVSIGGADLSAPIRRRRSRVVWLGRRADWRHYKYERNLERFFWPFRASKRPLGRVRELIIPSRRESAFEIRKLTDFGAF